MELANRELLVAQVVLSLVAWSSIAWVFFRPILERQDRVRALQWLLAPQLLRHVGMTLLSTSGVVGDLPSSFVTWVATGDLIAMLLSLVAFHVLPRSSRVGVPLAALATAVGLADIVHSLQLGIRIDAADQLGAGWLVVAFVVPLMVVMHVLAISTLFRRPRTSVRA